MKKNESYAVYENRFGKIKISYNNTEITNIRKISIEESQNEGLPSNLSDMAFKNIQEYIKGKRKSLDFPYVLYGTEFQNKVWQALCRIPYGETRTYKEIATEIGNPKASRAVGMANSRNPILIVVPCHRVVGTGGKLFGYAGGLDMKSELLKLEKTFKEDII
jgi:methylated-DNA-[protein]-cysteine S-methyltransferase